jgi:hypothetical protein
MARQLIGQNQMDRIQLFEQTLAACQGLPCDPPVLSILKQLEFLLDLERRQRCDAERLEDIIIGVLAVREIEPGHPSVADLLYRVDEQVEVMKQEWRASDPGSLRAQSCEKKA